MRNHCAEKPAAASLDGEGWLLQGNSPNHEHNAQHAPKVVVTRAFAAHHNKTRTSGNGRGASVEQLRNSSLLVYHQAPVKLGSALHRLGTASVRSPMDHERNEVLPGSTVDDGVKGFLDSQSSHTEDTRISHTEDTHQTCQ